MCPINLRQVPNNYSVDFFYLPLRLLPGERVAGPNPTAIKSNDPDDKNPTDYYEGKAFSRGPKCPMHIIFVSTVHTQKAFNA